MKQNANVRQRFAYSKRSQRLLLDAQYDVGRRLELSEFEIKANFIGLTRAAIYYTEFEIMSLSP